MQSRGPCDTQMSWDASKARDLPDTAAGCFRKWSLFGGDAPAFRSSRKHFYRPRRYCPSGPWRKMCVTAPRYRVQGPRLELLEHGLPCRTSGNFRAYGTILLCLTVAFFVGRLRWLRLPLSSLVSPFYGWGPGDLRVNWYPLGRGLFAFSIFSACRAVAWVFFSLPPAPSPK